MKTQGNSWFIVQGDTVRMKTEKSAWIFHFLDHSRRSHHLMSKMTIPRIVYGLLTWTTVQAISTSWTPLFPTTSSILRQTSTIFETSPEELTYDLGTSILAQHEQDRCTLYKIVMNQQLYFEEYPPNFHNYLHDTTTTEFLANELSLHRDPMSSHSYGRRPTTRCAVLGSKHPQEFLLHDEHQRAQLVQIELPAAIEQVVSLLPKLERPYRGVADLGQRRARRSRVQQQGKPGSDSRASGTECSRGLESGHRSRWDRNEPVKELRVANSDHAKNTVRTCEELGAAFSLVGHVIKGGGVAITGQEQRQLGGGFLEGEGSPPGSGGLLGEVTMVQLYGVALTAGKAHKDHKHHHAHHYEHDTDNNTPRPTRPPVTGPPLPQHPLLTGGQINHQVKINPGSPLQIVQGGVTLRHPAVIPRNPPPQPFPPANPNSVSAAYPLQSTQYFGNLPPSADLPSANRIITDASSTNGPYRLFKREKNSSELEAESEQPDSRIHETTTEKSKLEKRDVAEVSEKEDLDGKLTSAMKDSEDQKLEKQNSPKKKRGLVQFGNGLIMDDGYIAQGLDNDYFVGLTNFGLQLPKYENKDDEREPAEAEVKMIMDICDGCSEEPFAKALILGWRTVPKKMYSGAVYTPAVPMCKVF
ncbi:hypothetical protein WN48_06590 [Eufriesea mexicana]|uniref:Uncharacterized protein n=1 Tax=Eufriesea mexicana TaxID=516756 RepID=A0A310SBT4_9HYME|nr:hypothetical protein WN48_06590 [Eufriesea mexicana]